MKASSLALVAAWLAAAPAARALSAADEAVVDRGLDALYRCDYDGSERIFADALKERPGDPELSLGYAVAAWWRMESDFAPPGGPEERRFRAAVEKAIADAQGPAARGDAEALVSLGAAYGLRGRVEAAQRQWLKAYADGRRAYKSEKRALALDPTLVDAYLGIGAFDYYAARLSRFVRFFLFASPGDKAHGLEELERATKGRFGGVAAKLLIVGIDWTFEKKPREAWAILEELRARYPGSPVIESMRLVGELHLRDAEGLVADARAFIKRAESGAPGYRPVDAAFGYYFLGLGEELAGRFEEAIAHERRALELVPEGHRTRALAYLFIGEDQDLLGRRAEATASYRLALRQPPFWGVQRFAKRLLKRPFRPGDDPLPARSDPLD